MMRLRFLGVTLAAVLAMPAGGAGAQSVADVAKKSKESKDKKATVVITNDHLKPVDKSAAASSTAGSTQDAGEPVRTAEEDLYYKKFRGFLSQIDEMETNIKKWNQAGWLAPYSYTQRLAEQKAQFKEWQEKARKAGIQPGVLRAAEKDFQREKLERQSK
jgi:hypothetical protein